MLIIVMFCSYSLSHFSFSTWTFLFSMLFQHRHMFKLTDFSLEHILFSVSLNLTGAADAAHHIYPLFLTLPSLFGHRHSFSHTARRFLIIFQRAVFSPLAHLLLHAPAKNRNKRFFMINIRTHKRIGCERNEGYFVRFQRWRGEKGNVAERVKVAGERYANGFDESTECVCMCDGTACHTLAGRLWWENEWEEYGVGWGSFSSGLLCSHMHAYTAQSHHTGSNTRQRKASTKRRGKKSICKFIHLIKTWTCCRLYKSF